MSVIKRDPKTNEITLVVDDTDTIALPVTYIDPAGNRQMAPDGTVVIFAICSKQRRPYVDIPMRVVDGAAILVLHNQFTRTLKPGEYQWDLRVVVGADWAGDKVGANDPTDEVHSMFAHGELPVCRIKGAAVDVKGVEVNGG